MDFTGEKMRSMQSKGRHYSSPKYQPKSTSSKYNMSFKNSDIDKMDKMNLGMSGMYTGNTMFDIGLSIGRRLKKKQSNK